MGKKPINRVYLFRIVIFLLFYGASSKVSACWWYTGGITSTIYVSSSLSTINIQRDAAIGETVFEKEVINPNNQMVAVCTTGDVASWTFDGADIVPGYSNVYKTGVPGLGIRVQAGNSNFYYTNPATTFTEMNANRIWAWSNWGAYFKISLVKFAATGNGAIPAKRVRVNLTGLGDVLVLDITGGVINTVACSISSTNISVPLGDVLATQFTGVGATPVTKGFNLGLNCDANAKVNVSLSGTANSDIANSDILALTNAGTAGVADGLGVQVLYNGAPLKRDTNLLLKTSAGGVETLPFSARYFQTKSAVKPGKASATATLNLTYQ
ncbi:fimbrial protein [Serratia odorifera]|uniref:fimbrial protein n=1 Tax=Serratia odorifera TaxID=618 RepID=UPI0018E7B1BE|nr:fimbrial protein [Serratia odorifera]MBJ2066365.1 fimbrial protein [Serratia odorifera]